MEFFLNKRFSDDQLESRTEQTITIPVVIHVIHNGESIGQGSNISNEKIYGQIDILNKDYSFTNDDADQVPQAFKNDAADTNIRFCLVQKDASGNPHPGFNRIQYGDIPDFEYIENVIKKETSWNSKKFLNIWTVRMPKAHVLGYSYPPIPSILNTTADGVVIAYDKFGEGNNSLGRTATHEVGHYLGLIHPWGDLESCNNDDGIQDTPNSSSPYYGCPAYPQVSCGTVDMTMNFMEYVNDDCMYMFSHGQGSRMKSVLNNERLAITSGHEFICNIATALEKPSISSEINFYPNPTGDVLNIQLPEALKNNQLNIEIYSISGQLMNRSTQQTEDLNTIELSLGSLHDGTYMIKLSSAVDSFVLKAVLMSKH